MAQIAITSRPQRRTPLSRAFNASVPQPGPDLNGFVAAASAVVGQLADVIAEMVRA